jgi:hypothetical protein
MMDTQHLQDGEYAAHEVKEQAVQSVLRPEAASTDLRSLNLCHNSAAASAASASAAAAAVASVCSTQVS